MKGKPVSVYKNSGVIPIQNMGLLQTYQMYMNKGLK